MATEQVCIITSAGVRRCYDVVAMQLKVSQEPAPDPTDPSIGELIQIIRNLLIEADYKKGVAAVVTVLPTIESDESMAP